MDPNLVANTRNKLTLKVIIRIVWFKSNNQPNSTIETEKRLS
jgi:hypothetical protein